MKISYSWLKEYIDVNLTPQEMSDILTSIGLEVESLEKVEAVKGGLKGVVIGQVLTCAKHPDADKLSITTVNIGKTEPLNIVCGAPNVAAGQKVMVATVGTTLYFNDSELTLKKTRIRGQLSEGMICAEDELGLGTSHDGIMVLPSDAPIGTPASDFFNLEDDYQFEIGLTPNRIDAASHFGVARDLAAYLNLTKDTKATKPSVDHFKIDSNNLPIPVEVKNAEACPRYSGLTISNVRVGPSPEWLQKRLRSIGLSPINNVVDVTNFVLHEVGQPLHAFDADKIEGKKVVVGTLPQDSPFTTLDDVERKLSSEDLMICNTTEGMCIAGVFGGNKSGVNEGTKNIFLESAYFNPVWIRKTAKRHGLSTDASFRYERGADPNITIWALKRAAMLIKEITGGKISSEIVDVYPNPVENFRVELSIDYTTKLIGKNIPKETIRQILTGLDIAIEAENDDMLSLSIPPYRVDVQRPADVVEEILRIYGYNNVEISNKVNSTLAHSTRPNKQMVTKLISDTLTGIGMYEIMCNSLTKKAYYDKLKTYPTENTVEIINPLSTDLNGLRQTLLFGGLESVIYNINRKKGNLKLYEWGNCYTFDKTKESYEVALKAYNEDMRLALWLTGDDTEESWMKKQEKITFYHLKANVFNILDKLGIDTNSLNLSEAPSDIFEYGISLVINGKTLGYLGMVSKRICKDFDIKQEVYFAELEWESLFKMAKKNRVQFNEIPKYPEVRRDLALLVNEDVTFAQIKEVAQKSERKLVKDINLFDVYKGANLGKGKKSYAVSFILQDDSKTLTDKQIDKVMNNLIGAFDRDLGAQIR
ncbi:MAG: phenylalanine--tRNA ligase subunit beta [Tenuifilaceae bacterium]|nr:phenylalanine--tRNA ligase subunit beta [Tenuifilaceae bacterium]